MRICKKKMITWPLPLFLVGALVGCGGMKQVEGIVTLDGKAVEGASVSFLPAEDGTGQPADGVTDSGGKFTLSTRGKKGIAPGTYKVTVAKSKPLASVDPSKMKPGSPEYMKMMEEKAGKGKKGGPTTGSELPVKYASAQSSPFTFTIPTDKQPIELAMTSK